MDTDGALWNQSGVQSGQGYYNWYSSVSVEYGWRLRCPTTNSWFEPSDKLLCGQLDSVDFHSDHGVMV